MKCRSLPVTFQVGTEEAVTYNTTSYSRHQMEVGGQYRAPGTYFQGRAPVPMVQEDGWVQGQSGTGVGNRKSLYPISYREAPSP